MLITRISSIICNLLNGAKYYRTKRDFRNLSEAETHKAQFKKYGNEMQRKKQLQKIKLA